MKNSHFAPLFALAFVAACEKNDLNTTTDSTNRAVVESFLQPSTLPTVFIKKQLLYGSTDTVQAPILGLDVSIENVETGEKHALIHTDSTAYVDSSGWRVESGKTYRLAFEYLGKTITAETSIPAPPVHFKASAASIKAFVFSFPPSFPDPVKLTWDNPEGGYYLVVVETADANPEEIDGSGGNGSFKPPFSFRTKPEQASSYSLEATSFKYYGNHRVILYHLNAEYAALYEDSGSNSTNLTTPYTNVLGGLGIFTGIESDTLLVKVTK